MFWLLAKVNYPPSVIPPASGHATHEGTGTALTGIEVSLWMVIVGCILVAAAVTLVASWLIARKDRRDARLQSTERS